MLKVSGISLQVRGKSGKSQGIFFNLMCGNPEKEKHYQGFITRYYLLSRSEEVLRRIGRNRMLLISMYRTRLRIFGHVTNVTRRGGLGRVVTTGKIEGERVRGRQTAKYMNNIKVVLQMKVYDIIRMIEDRERWHGITVDVRI